MQASSYAESQQLNGEPEPKNNNHVKPTQLVHSLMRSFLDHVQSGRLDVLLENIEKWSFAEEVGGARERCDFVIVAPKEETESVFRDIFSTLFDLIDGEPLSRKEKESEPAISFLAYRKKKRRSSTASIEQLDHSCDELDHDGIEITSTIPPTSPLATMNYGADGAGTTSPKRLLLSSSSVATTGGAALSSGFLFAADIRIWRDAMEDGTWNNLYTLLYDNLVVWGQRFKRLGGRLRFQRRNADDGRELAIIAIQMTMDIVHTPIFGFLAGEPLRSRASSIDEVIGNFATSTPYRPSGAAARTSKVSPHSSAHDPLDAVSRGKDDSISVSTHELPTNLRRPRGIVQMETSSPSTGPIPILLGAAAAARSAASSATTEDSTAAAAAAGSSPQSMGFLGRLSSLGASMKSMKKLPISMPTSPMSTAIIPVPSEDTLSPLELGAGGFSPRIGAGGFSPSIGADGFSPSMPTTPRSTASLLSSLLSSRTKSSSSNITVSPEGVGSGSWSGTGSSGSSPFPGAATGSRSSSFSSRNGGSRMSFNLLRMSSSSARVAAALAGGGEGVERGGGLRPNHSVDGLPMLLSEDTNRCDAALSKSYHGCTRQSPKTMMIVPPSPSYDLSRSEHAMPRRLLFRKDLVAAVTGRGRPGPATGFAANDTFPASPVSATATIATSTTGTTAAAAASPPVALLMSHSAAPSSPSEQPSHTPTDLSSATSSMITNEVEVEVKSKSMIEAAGDANRHRHTSSSSSRGHKEEKEKEEGKYVGAANRSPTNMRSEEEEEVVEVRESSKREQFSSMVEESDDDDDARDDDQEIRDDDHRDHGDDDADNDDDREHEIVPADKNSPRSTGMTFLEELESRQMHIAKNSLLGGEHGERRHFLVINHCTPSRKAICRMIIQQGQHVTEALDALDGLRTYDEESAKGADGGGDDDSFDFILIDEDLPYMSGKEVTKALRGRGYSKPIIGLTTEQHDYVAKGFTDSGANAVLIRPFSLEELQAVLNRVRIQERCESSV